MKKLTMLLVMTLAALLMTLPALAEPMVSAGGYTAWLGESSHMYLQDPLGAQKVLRYPIADIIAIADGSVYAVAQDGRLFAIRVDGTQTIVLATAPTEADIAAVTPAAPFALEDGALYAMLTNGTRQLLSTAVTAAAANDDRIFFVTQTQTGVTSLKAVPMTILDGSSPNVLPTLLGMGVENAVNMTATQDALAIVGSNGTVTVLSLIDMSRREYPGSGAEVTRAVALGTQVLCYSQNEQGWWLLMPSLADSTLPTLEDAASGSDAVTRAPGYSYYSATATPTPTLRPTATPTPTPTPPPTAPPQTTPT
ncbi:MAG: hypothetical protein IKK57_00285, partial [Clostridia bacterium]|nr:hypothetical protein [Clostridia bacterium]